jgi:hypothetical protein
MRRRRRRRRRRRTSQINIYIQYSLKSTKLYH